MEKYVVFSILYGIIKVRYKKTCMEALRDRAIGAYFLFGEVLF